MIRLEFNPSQLTGDQKVLWDTWCQKAEQATRDVIKAWETTNHQLPIASHDDIWKDLRKNLLNALLPDKCAYCEAPLTRDYGAVEHYRPKGAVIYKQEETGQPADTTTEDEAGKSCPHPGYFWLAYHWKNLIPSCDKCNSGKGKQNQFPVKTKHRMVKRLPATEIATLGDTPFKSPNRPDVVYLEPDELNELEQPLLLHPYGSGDDDPRRHLCFGEGGIEAPREIDGVPSPKEKVTIEVCQLFTPELRRERHHAQRTALMQYLTQLAAQVELPGGPTQAVQRVRDTPFLTQLKAGSRPYSAAALDYIDLMCKTLGQSS